MFDNLPEDWHASIDAHKYWEKANHAPIARLFLSKLSNFLMETYFVPREYARGAADELLLSMRARNLSYHNPLHILSILDWAELNGIELDKREKLALWFHDAICDPEVTGGINEKKSAVFARIILTRIGICSEDVEWIVNGILDTALHEEENRDAVSAEYDLLMDVDICVFAWDEQNRLAQDKAVSMEYIPRIGAEQWETGRKAFLCGLLDRGFVFRSYDFLKFEVQATQNLKDMLN